MKKFIILSVLLSLPFLIPQTSYANCYQAPNNDFYANCTPNSGKSICSGIQPPMCCDTAPECPIPTITPTPGLFPTITPFPTPSCGRFQGDVCCPGSVCNSPLICGGGNTCYQTCSAIGGQCKVACNAITENNVGQLGCQILTTCCIPNPTPDPQSCVTQGGSCQIAAFSCTEVFNSQNLCNIGFKCCLPNNGGAPTPGSASEGCLNTNFVNTAMGCLDVTGTNTISSLLSWGVGLGGGIAFLIIVLSGFQLVTAGGDAKRVKAAQELLTAAISGLVLIILSLILLNFIGVNVLGLQGLGFHL